VVAEVVTETNTWVLVPGGRKISDCATNWAVGADRFMGESEIERLIEPKNPSTVLKVTRARPYCCLDKVSIVGEIDMAKFPQKPVLSSIVSVTTVPPSTTVTQKLGEALVPEQPVWKPTLIFGTALVML